MNKSKVLFIVLAIMLLIVLGFILLIGNKTKVTNNNYPIYDNVENIIKKQIKQQNAEVEIKGVKMAVPIFMYHWIEEDTGTYPYIENMVRPDTLKEQVKYVAENGFQTIFITELDSIAKYNKPVAFTFDDAFVSVYLYAFPIFKEYNIKGTIFVISEFVDQPGYCTKEMLKEMKESGLMDLQCHTATHPYLAEVSREEMASQMQRCNDYLKKEFGVTSTIICYPYGSRNSITIDEAKKHGFKYGLAMDGGVYYSNIDNDYEISRIYATRSMPISEFIGYLNRSSVKVDY